MMQACAEWNDPSPEQFFTEIVPRGAPAILRGHAASWPMTRAAEGGDEALANHLKGFASSAPALTFIGPPEIAGRFFYTEDMKGLNFERVLLQVGDVLDRILAQRSAPRPLSIYAGGVPVRTHLPGLEVQNRSPLIDPAGHNLISLWIGNRTRIAAHWDLPQNLVCVVRGRRRFTMFPAEQVANLYVGPLDFTLAGQPCSMVDFAAPDFERFPRFRLALDSAQEALLEPGDALYMPSLYWHHVEADDSFGAMMNFWWRNGPSHLVTPMLTLIHALLTLRDLPEDERARWQAMFAHYIFEANGDPFAHLPDHARGVFGPQTPQTLHAIKEHLLASLKR